MITTSYLRKIAVAIIILTWCAPSVPSSQELDRTVAIVRLHQTVNISRNELRRRTSLLEEQLDRDLTRSETDQLLDAMVSAELLKQDAEKMSITVSDTDINRSITQQRELLGQQARREISQTEFRRLIEEQTKIAWNDYREQVKNRLIQEKYIFRAKGDLLSSIQEPTAREMENYYDRNATEFTNPAIVQIQFLLVSTQNISDSERRRRRSLAEDLLKDATKSVSAFDRARQDSLDNPNVDATEVLILRDNELQSQAYGSAFINAIFALSNNSFGKDVIESKLGYHIVRVIDKRAPKVLLLDDPVLPGQNITVRDQVRNLLLLEKQQDTIRQAVAESLDELRNQADIQLFPNNI